VNKQDVRRYLGVIKRACDLIEEAMGREEFDQVIQQIEQESPAPKPLPVAKPPVESVALPAPEVESVAKARKKHVEDLMAIDCWPEAVPNFRMVTSDEQQIDRANSILDFVIGKSMEGARFLDFGCGEGWLARQAAMRGPVLTHGYDKVKDKRWADFSNVVFTDQFDEIKEYKYDIIFMYDVLDHCTEPVAVMDQVRSVLAPKGLVHVRCHPWTSKHASHLPKQGLNKAYIHLFLSWEELHDLGYDAMFTRNETNPFEAYRWWFKDFKVEIERKFPPDPLSDFFKVESFKQLIIEQQKLEPGRVEGFFQDMDIPFVDYVLMHKE
jgi:SAM-dependent methyltransferase